MGAKVKAVWSQDKPLAAIYDRYGKGQLQKVVFQACTLVRNEAVEQIATGAKTGKVYKRGNIQHQASAPGEYPATDTGELINSITVKFASKGLRGVVESNAPHAAHLEFGTRNMAPRPFLQPATEFARPKIRAMLKRIAQGK